MRYFSLVTAARAGLGTAFVAWTAYWIAAALPMLRATPLGSGAWRPVLQAHEVLEALFTVATPGVRWLPGAILLVGLFVWLGRRQRAGSGDGLGRPADARV